MGALLLTLPGDIEGLLRCWSPSLTMFEGIEVRGAWLPRRLPGASAGYVVAQFERTDRVIEYARDLHEVYLDLTDPTGRAHAAWWAATAIQAASPRKPLDRPWPPAATDPHPWLTSAHFSAIHVAMRGDPDMTPDQIDTLCRLVLRLAGRS